jgi:hypothetical protein
MQAFPFRGRANIMMLAFLDELGHTGRYTSRTDELYQSSPLFGFGGYVIDSDKVRDLVDGVLAQKAKYLKRPLRKVITRELKARELFEPGLFTPKKPRKARKRVNQLASKSIALLKQCGGKICFYAREKAINDPEHNDGELERACLRRMISIIHDELQAKQAPCLVIIDQHNNHYKKVKVIAYPMAVNGYFRELAEPPVMADSRISTAMQLCDWIAGLLNKVYIPATQSKDQWPELANYRTKYLPMLTSDCLPGSHIKLSTASLQSK